MVKFAHLMLHLVVVQSVLVLIAWLLLEQVGVLAAAAALLLAALALLLLEHLDRVAVNDIA